MATEKPDSAGEVVKMSKLRTYKDTVYVDFNLSKKLVEFLNLGEGDVVKIHARTVDGKKSRFSRSLNKPNKQGQFEVYLPNGEKEALEVVPGDLVFIEVEKK